MFSIGATVYYINNDADEMPRIKWGVVAKKDTPLIREGLITVVDAEKPDDRWMWEFLEPDRLSHTIAGAHTMLGKVIDTRIQGLRDDIAALVTYKEAQLKGM